MIEHQPHVRFFDQRQQREQLILLDLDLQKQSEINQFFQKRRGVAIIVGAVKRHVEGHADDTGRLQPFEFADTDVILDHRDALEAAVTLLERIEQNAAVGAVAGIGADDRARG